MHWNSSRETRTGSAVRYCGCAQRIRNAVTAKTGIQKIRRHQSTTECLLRDGFVQSTCSKDNSSIVRMRMGGFLQASHAPRI